MPLVLRLGDGLTLTQTEARKLPLVALGDLDEILARISVRKRTNGSIVVGRVRGGHLALARYLRRQGWHPVAGGWLHEKHQHSKPVSDETHAMHVWASHAPLVPWEPATAGQNEETPIREGKS